MVAAMVFQQTLQLTPSDAVDHGLLTMLPFRILLLALLVPPMLPFMVILCFSGGYSLKRACKR